MFSFLQTIWQDLHPIVVHFPIALLIIAVLLSYASRWYADLQQTTWLLLVLGTLAAIPATITGLVAHFPYEETVLHDVIETHQLLAFGTTFLFLGLTAWRWRARRAGNDNGSTWPFLAVLTVGLILITLVGGTGGTLVYEFAVNVRGVNPLLP